MANLTCSCGHGDLSPNFHLHPCPIRNAYMAGIAVGRSQGRAEGRAALVAKIAALAEELGAPVQGLGLRSSDGTPMAPLYGGEDVAYRLRRLIEEMTRIRDALVVTDQE